MSTEELGIIEPTQELGISMRLTEELVADVAEHYGEPGAESVIAGAVEVFERKLRDKINAYAARQQ